MEMLFVWWDKLSDKTNLPVVTISLALLGPLAMISMLFYNQLALVNFRVWKVKPGVIFTTAVVYVVVFYSWWLAWVGM